jgi:hypothetical protein
MGFRDRQQFDLAGISPGLSARFGHPRSDARYPPHELLV